MIQEKAFVGTISDVVELEAFRKSRQELGITDDELNELKNAIINNPNVGDAISGCNGARKVRIKLESNNKGKSGGARIIYVNVYIQEKAYLIDIYGKSDKEDLTTKEKKLISTIIDILKNKK